MTQPVPNSIAAMAEELTAWRRDLHAHPELGYEETRTAGLVAERLRAFGFDAVETGVGRTGVVGILHGASGPAESAEKRVVLRADMDALPMQETSGRPWASTAPGRMHACGHDGHTTMLLGAAKHLAETRSFDGTLVFVFQPAEEGGGGALAMIEDGLLERWPVRMAFGLHNMPGAPVGAMGTTPGAAMAYADHFVIRVTGRGGHAAFPHMAADPIVAAAQLVTAFQSIVSRRRDPMQPAVISVTRINGGTADNVIPGEVTLTGTVRTLSDDLARFLCDEMRRQCRAVGEAMGVEIDDSQIGLHPYPVCWNDPDATDFAVSVMREVVGEGAVDPAATPVLGGEDFAFFGKRVPSSFVFLGIGEAAPLHHPDYDFNDAAAPIGVAYWTRLAERALPRG